MVRTAIVTFAFLASCSPSIDQPAVEASVKRNLRDPASAQFRNLELNEDGTVCGEVNARNGFGGMSGFMPFLYTKDGSLVYTGEDEAVAIINGCSSKFDAWVADARKSESTF